MAALEEGFQYGLSSNSISTSNRTVVHVKLTDTSLQIIEDYLRKKNTTSQKPCIQFEGNQGIIQIPAKENEMRTFQFSLSAIQGEPNGSFDAVCQPNSRSGQQLVLEGSMTNKIQIHATNELFKATKDRVAQAELDVKKVSTKEIKPSGPHISRKKTTVIRNQQHQVTPRHQLAQPTKPKPSAAPPVNFTKRPSPSYGSQGHAVSPHNPTSVTSSKPTSPSLSSHSSGSTSAKPSGNPAVMSMPYRDRIIHLLAIRPYKKPELIIRLRKGEILEYYGKRSRSVSESDMSLRHQLTDLEKHMLDTHELVEIRGKNGTRVPVIIPQEAVAAVAYLANPVIRKNSGIKENNPYLFANSGLDVLRAASSLEETRRECGLKFPDRVHATNLRKHCATIAQENKSDKEGYINLLSFKNTTFCIGNEKTNRLKADGIREKDKDSLGTILNQVAVSKDNTFTLAKHVYTEVRSDWPFYTDEDRHILTKKLQSTSSVSPSASPANRSPDSQSTNLNTKKSEPLKRSIEESQQSTQNSNKKQRISLYEKPSHRTEHRSVTSDKHSSNSVSSTTDISDKKENIDDTVDSTSDTPEYMRQYFPIATDDQRYKYKQDFNEEYEEYRNLHTSIDKVSKKFCEMQDIRKKMQKGTPEYEDLEEKIRSEYMLQKSDPKFIEQMKRYKYLHSKLAYIKNLIVDYDQKIIAVSS